MNRKWDAIRGNIGFFVTMAVCLLVVAVCGYFLLLNNDTAPLEAPTPAVTDAAVTTSVPEEIPVEDTSEPQESLEEVIAMTTPPAETSAPMPEVEVDDTPVVAEAPQLIVTPLDGEVLTAFSVDQLVYNPTLEDWRIHDGVDISAVVGTSVLAACSGTVLAVEDDPLMGTTVILDHGDGYHTTYANLQATPAVQAGDSVSAGQIIGAVGTTAAVEASQPPHLHFSVTKDGDVVDPEGFLNR